MTIKLVASEGLTHGPWPHVPGLLWGRASVGTGMFGRERRTLKQQQQQTLLYWPRKQERRLKLSQSEMNGRRGMAVHSYNPNTYVAETGRLAQVLGANLDNMWDPSQKKRKSRETENWLILKYPPQAHVLNELLAPPVALFSEALETSGNRT